MTSKIDGFTYTTGIKKLRQLKKRIKVVPGGTSGGKTYGILPILIDRATKNKNLEISVVSESVPHLRKGALKDFLKIMKATGRYIDKNYNRTFLTYTFATGSYIEFFSADQEEKVRGPRRNILYINECNNINFDTYHQLAIRTDIEIWLDFNPSADFWAYEELTSDKDAEWCTLTYKDNEALAEAIVTEIEKAKYKGFFNPELAGPALFAESNIKSQYWANWWKVYGLGQLGALQGVVFNNWSLCDEIPAGAKRIAIGLDFGFTNDPTGAIDVYMQDGELWLDELLYQTGMTNPVIAAELKKHITSSDEVIADSAEPKSIEELNQLGLRVLPSVKGPDSVKNGIDILQRYKFHVTKRSTNLIKELRTYCWETDRTGKPLNEPIDSYNHLIDPLRYIALIKLRVYTPRETSFGWDD
jgi:phage terminase large subunit